MHSMAPSLSQGPEEEGHRNKRVKSREEIEVSESEEKIFFPMSFSGGDRPTMEHLWSGDDAWYGVILYLVGDVLWVRYDGFPSDDDEIFPASSEIFSSSDEIRRFGSTFRGASVQMQDSQCGTVKEGTVVCASHHFATGDVKFCDASLVKVEKAKHTEDGRSEVCRCTYWLSWRHGPLACKVTPAKIDNICLRPENKNIDPTLIMFLKKANEKLLQKSRYVPESSGTRSAPMYHLSSSAEASAERTIAHGTVAEPSSGNNGARRPPLSPTTQCDLITRAREQGSMRAGTSRSNHGKSTLCYSQRSSLNREVSLHKKVALREQMKHEGLTLPSSRPKLCSSSGGIVICEETEKTIAPTAVRGGVAGEQVTQTNERDAAHHQQQPPNNDLNFYSRRRNTCAKRTEEGKLDGKCKKRPGRR